MNTHHDHGDGRRGSGEITISSTMVAICGLVLGLASLLALVVVASVQGANALSVVATTIALLAFIVQIQVFSHQSKLSTEQMRRSEEINADTRALLTEIRAAATSTGDTVNEMYKGGMALGTLEGAFEGLPAITHSGGRTESQSGRVSLPTDGRVRDRALARARARRLFESFPAEPAGAAVLADLPALDLEQRQRVRELAMDERDMMIEDSAETLGLPWVAADSSLAGFGLTGKAEIELRGARHVVSRLTERGRTLACLLLAPGEPPAYAADALARISHGPVGSVRSADSNSAAA
jgi:hypothetical protein